jgi:cytochrome c-type biogenesis protein CcmE
MTENEDFEKEDMPQEEAEEPPEKTEPEIQEKRARPKRFWTKKKKILIVVAIIAIALFVALWGAAPGDYMTVKELLKDKDSYIGEEVEVKGNVGNWSGGQNFTLLDDSNATFAVFVVHNSAMPEGFASGKIVVVSGTLENRADGLTIMSTKIQVGCPSKY